MKFVTNLLLTPQKTIRIEPGETPLSLSKKILTEEHINYPVEIGKLLANGQ